LADPGVVVHLGNRAAGERESAGVLVEVAVVPLERGLHVALVDVTGAAGVDGDAGDGRGRNGERDERDGADDELAH
jgi:hypothetical protein